MADYQAEFRRIIDKELSDYAERVEQVGRIHDMKRLSRTKDQIWRVSPLPKTRR